MKEIRSLGSFICRAKVANTFLSNGLGLMLRGSMPKEEGLLIEFSSQFKSRGVHSFFMRFPIDLVFINSNKKVVDLYSLPPWKSYTPRKDCKWVLELNKGVCEGKIKKGDLLDFETD